MITKLNKARKSRLTKKNIDNQVEVRDRGKSHTAKLQGYPTAEEIAEFIVHRKKRSTAKNMMKYEYNVHLYLAEIFLKDKRGNLASRSAILRNPIRFKMDLDHARDIFERIDTWTSEGADKFWLKQAHVSDDE